MENGDEGVNPYCSIYCEHNADGECGCEPCVYIRTHGFSGHLTGCPYGRGPDE